ncbi:MAG: hypothetical protein KAT68_15240 [Bacteroidales bacterium]|nr:hypothetical protein [Bacteroidales bacterium]
MGEIKLNIGCGTDYRKDFINIDGSNSLEKVDKIIKIPEESLLNFYGKNSIDFILCKDFIEHHFHWEAIKILTEFYEILKKDSMIEIRVPDCEYIIRSRKFKIKTKLTLLFGGQDIPQGVDKEMDKSRKEFPQFFCHKFGWTKFSMKNDLLNIGFYIINIKRVGTNFIVIAKK